MSNSRSSFAPFDLPGPNWCFCKIDEKSLMICELMIPMDSERPRIRKHIHMNLTNGVCTSYVMDRKISDMPTSTLHDVERCIEELHMMHICIGGPAASKFPPAIRTNSRVDVFGNWRHNSCKIFVATTDLPCNACELLQHELSQLAHTSKQKELNVGTRKRVLIGNLSHRKQSQIIALRKRRQSWYRKKRNAEKEMKMIEDMIAEISEEPEENPRIDDEDNEDDE